MSSMTLAHRPEPAHRLQKTSNPEASNPATSPAPTATGARLTVESVTRIFSDGTGLHPTSFTIEPGEFVSVLGPSGCGKSTLLRGLAGLETPQAGRISFGDRVVFDSDARISLAPRHRRIGMVFQDLALWPHLSAFENVAFPLRVAKRKNEVRSAVSNALELVGLTAYADKLPHQLSGGQQQRVAIARAIVSRPDVLLMDEPMSALDAALKVQLRAELKALTRQLGVTTVFVTHDQEEAMGMSDRIAVLSAGRMLQLSAPEELYEQPAHLEVAEFVGVFNRLPGDGVRGVRPERLEVAPRSRANATGSTHAGEATRDAAGAGALDFTATVTSCDYRGGSYRLAAQVPGSARAWSVVSPRPYAPGDTVELRVHESDVIDLTRAAR